MLENDAIEITYDDLPYPSMTIPDTHPDHLAAIARFHGLETASPQKCRVLELGCGNGSNLNWMASTLPESEFIGIDLSKNHIIEAQKTLSKLSTNNASFLQQDVLEIDGKSFGKFDYIVAHGLFSWVPEAVAEKVLDLYGELLNPNGVGYISYNVLPGFHLRNVIRDAMQFHTRNNSSPFDMVKNGREFARFLSQNSPDTSPFKQVLNFEYEKMDFREDSNLFHDDLSTFNNPFYFSDFIGRAEKRGLQFVSEAVNLNCLPPNLPPDVLQFIENNSNNVIDSEQYIDLFKGVRFRKTLLCRKEIKLDREFKPDTVKTFFISSSLRPDSAVIKTEKDKIEKFISDSGSSFETDHMLTKELLTCFKTSKRHEIPFEELIEQSRAVLDKKGFSSDSGEEDIDATISILIQLYMNDMIRFHVSRSAALNYAPEKPKVSDYARAQAQKGERVPTAHGANIRLSDDFSRELFAFLTGEKTRGELVEALVPKLYHAKEEEIDREEFTKLISITLDETLEQMARAQLII